MIQTLYTVRRPEKEADARILPPKENGNTEQKRNWAQKAILKIEKIEREGD